MKRLLVLGVMAATVLFGVYAVLTLYDDNMHFGRMQETPGIRPHEEPLPAMEAGVVPFSGGEALLRATPEDQLHPMADLGSAQTVLKDGALFYTYYCIQCHGDDYDGQGTVGQSFNPLPTDLKSPKVQSMTRASLFKHISYGIPGGRQPPLATTISPTERWEIVTFIKSLGRRPTQSL